MSLPLITSRTGLPAVHQVLVIEEDAPVGELVQHEQRRLRWVHRGVAVLLVIGLDGQSRVVG